MRIMGIDDIRQIPFDLEHDIQVNHRGGWSLGVEGFERFNEALAQRLDPINIPGVVLRQYLQGDSLLLLGCRLRSCVLLCVPCG